MPLGPYGTHSNIILEVTATHTCAAWSLLRKPMSIFQQLPLGFWQKTPSCCHPVRTVQEKKNCMCLNSSFSSVLAQLKTTRDTSIPVKAALPNYCNDKGDKRQK